MFVFDSFMFKGMFNVIIVRERKHFWDFKPSKLLVLSILCDSIVILIISSTLNLFDLASIDQSTSFIVLIYSLAVCLLINDSIKAFLIKKFWARI